MNKFSKKDVKQNNLKQNEGVKNRSNNFFDTLTIEEEEDDEEEEE